MQPAIDQRTARRFLEDTQGIDLPEVLAGSKEFSPNHLIEFVKRIKDEYSVAGKEILDTISSILEIPEDVQHFDPTAFHVNAVFFCFYALVEVAQWYRAGHSSAIHPRILVSEPLAKKYIFWSLLFLGIPATATSPNPPLKCLPPHLQLGYYQHVPALFSCLFGLSGITYQSFPSALKPALINVAIAWWTALFKGQPPIYPMGRKDPDPEADGGDLPVAFFHILVEQDPQGFASAIMNGGICPPETFVERTIGRMRAYSNIGALEHLSHFPPYTVEIGNMGAIAQVTSTLMETDKRLRDLFMEGGVSGAYIKSYAAMGKGTEMRVVEKGTQTVHTQEAMHMKTLVTLAYQVVDWSTSSPTSVLRRMKDVASSGIIQLMSSGRALHRDERLGTLDKTFDIMTLYAQFLDVFPPIYEDVIKFFEPSAFDSRSFLGGNNSLDTYLSARSNNFSLDVAGLKIMHQFVKKEDRVRLCDNLKHYDKMTEPCESKSQAENACSRCHSVVYCSAECQMEDWRAFHRSECAKMAKDHKDRKARDQVYSYHDRAFQASFMRYQYESLAAQHDRGETPYAHGRDGIVVVDIMRPFATLPLPSAPFLQSYLPDIPNHILPRMKEFIATFSSSCGAYRGVDPAQIRRQNIRLLFRSFPFGSEDVHLFLLLKRVHYAEFDGTDLLDQMEKAHEFMFRGPQARSDYVVKGCLTYMAPPRDHTRTKQPAPSTEDFMRV